LLLPEKSCKIGLLAHKNRQEMLQRARIKFVASWVIFDQSDCTSTDATSFLTCCQILNATNFLLAAALENFDDH